MKKDSYFEGWGYSDTIKLLIKGRFEDTNKFYTELKKTFPKDDIVKINPDTIEAFIYEQQIPVVKKMATLFKMKIAYKEGGSTEDNSIAKIILDQLGGQRKLILMTGAYHFMAYKDGVGFKIKNRKVNYIQIVLNAKDLYNVTFSKTFKETLKKVSYHEDIYFDELIPLFEKQTGMYIKFAEGGQTPKKLIYVLYGAKDEADNLLNANGTRNRGWWRSDLSRTESDELLQQLKDQKLIIGAIIYIGDYSNIKFVKGGKTSSSLKIGDKVEGYFHYDHTYGQYNIIPYNAYADTSEGVVVDIFEGGLLGQRYEIKFKNGETKRLSETMLGEYYDKLRFADGGIAQGMSIADANPYIAGAKVVQGIAPESVSALDKKMASRINPDPYRPVFFKKGGGIENQYDGLNSKQVYELWNYGQKYEFFKDHFENKGIYTFYEYKKLPSMKYEDLDFTTKKALDEHIKGGQYKNGGVVVTSITEIPNFKQRLDEGKITYRGLGMGKLMDDFYKLAGESGTRIKVDGKEYFITDTEFDSFSRGADGRLRIRFDAPFRKN